MHTISVTSCEVFCSADVNVPSHDWWLYQAISACGGKSLRRLPFGALPAAFRQCHRLECGLGGPHAPPEMFRLGHFRHWADFSETALMRLRPRMTAENQRIFDLFCKARHAPLLQRALIFAQTGVTARPSWATWGLAAPVLLKMI